MRIFYYLIISLFSVLLLFGCNKQKSADKAVDILEINNTVYTTEDLWKYANVILWQMEPKDLLNQEIKSTILEDFIQHNILLQEARRPSVLANLNYDKGKFEQLSIQLSTERGEKELRALTGKYEINAGDVLRILEERLIIDSLLQWLIRDDSIFIPEDDIKTLFNAKKLPKNPVGEAHIMHIFTTDNETIHLVARELAAGIQFSELARKYSQSPEKEYGGDLGYIKESSYPDFFSAAFILKEGETSAIVKSEFGYHIFKMVQYAKAGKNTLNSLKPLLLSELYSNERNRIIGEYINVLYSKANVKKLNDFELSDIFPSTGQK